VTDSVPRPNAPASPSVQIISLKDLIAEAIIRLHASYD
jgi:phosphoribosylpyrophosphate synthetase